MNKSFPAKILLFGEYTIMNGGTALAMPFDKFKGKWEPGKSDTELVAFFIYLSSLPGVDKEKITLAIDQKWHFDSDIPIGYGLGSSGAICAAAYDAFFGNKEKELAPLKQKLSEIESHFHGKSSGLDPLTCYLEKPVLIKEGKISVLEKIELPPELRLYDSGLTRNGKPLIKFYLDRLEVDDAFDEVVLALSRFNDRIVDELIAGESIEKSFEEISHIQFTHFKHMIPEKTMKLWQKGIDSGSYFMKLSGAGGGGYFLVYEKGKYERFRRFGRRGKSVS